MNEKRIKEVSAYATHRLITGDILAAYALELAIELQDAERERDHARAEMDEIATAVGYGAISKSQGRLTGKELADRWDKLETELAEASVKVDQLRRERDQAKAQLSAAHAFHDLAVKERDAERTRNTMLRLELESATRNMARLLAAVEAWESKYNEMSAMIGAGK